MEKLKELFSKLDIKVVLVILLVLTWIIAGVGIFFVKKNAAADVQDKIAEAESLRATIDKLGYMMPAYKLRADVKSGQVIEETDLEPIESPSTLSSRIVTDIDEVVGKYYKIDLSEDSILTHDMVYEEIITDDARYFDIVLHSYPIGLRPGDYIDIRITMPFGEDYVAMSHKRVIEINSGVLKIPVTTEDIHTYNSMLVDSLLYTGTQLYAVQYIQGAAQKPADVYYPVSKNVVSIAQRDPNLLNAIKADILQRRDQLEVSLSQINLDERKLESILAKGKSDIAKSMAESQRVVDRERAEFEKQQAREAAKKNK